MVQSWSHNQSITLTKWTDYWNKGGASPNSATLGYVDTINMPIYTDTNTEWLAFQKGTIDYSTIPTGNFRAAQNNPSTKDGTWTVKAYPSTAVYFISVSMNKPMLGGSANLPIRAALNYAADRTAVSQIVNEGISIPSDEIVPITIPGYVAGLNPYPYDPAKAQPELDKFTGTLPQNIPYGFNSGAGHDKIAQALIAGWQKAMPSLTFKLNGIETNSYWTQAGQNKAPALLRMGWIADYPSIDNFIYLFTTEGGKYGSYSWYSNPQVDKLFKQARSTIDQTQRFNLYNEAQKLILTDAPCVPVYTYRDARATNNRIGGFSYNSFGLVNMWSVWVK
jgi:peptide/nickel transport system substrate-binding protein/oligopeptide transport system substrate-binding protein